MVLDSISRRKCKKDTILQVDLAEILRTIKGFKKSQQFSQRKYKNVKMRF